MGVTSSTGTSQVSSAQRIPRRAAALLEKIAAFGPAAFLSVRSFLLPRRRRASSGLRSRWSVMEPAALLVLVCCQPQLPASSSSSLSKHASCCRPPGSGCTPQPACKVLDQLVRPAWRHELHRHSASKQRAAHPSPRSGAFRKNGLLLKRAMERFSLELEATEVFYGKNQSCRACRVEHACTFALRALRRHHLVSPRPM